MISDTLQDLLDRGLTSAREIGELTGVAPSTVYRWLRGESEPGAETICLLIRLLPNRDAQESLLLALTASTSWRMVNIELDLDVNHDGCVDIDDALDATIAAVQAAADSLTKVRETQEQSNLTQHRVTQLVQQLNHVMRHCAVTQGVLLEMAHRRQQRQLRPMSYPSFRKESGTEGNAVAF